MSCGCNSNPCSCLPRPSICCTPTVESVTYTFENGNLAGIGVFDNETDNLVQFRGVVSDSVALTVTLNATDNTIVLDFDSSALVADIPDATTTQRGILETATNAEALAKAATDKILTPSNLAALGSTTSFAGLVELATDAETIAGISSTLAVTPAGLAAVGATNTLTTWADAVTRAGATPTYDGQMGVQLDTNSPWVAVGTVAGNFSIQVPATDADFLLSNIGTPTWTITTGLLLTGPGDLELTNFNSIEFNTGPVTFNGLTEIGAVIDFQNGSEIYAAGVVVPANNVLITGGLAGHLTSYAISNFLSAANTQTGYTAFANPATLRTCDTATVTLQQLAQIVGTLIEDLKALQVPAT